MGPINYYSVAMFLIFIAVFALFYKRWMLDALIEAIHNFRGGPPTPRHPLPADDGFLILRKRSRKKQN
jgi:HAMP domain-containing protein